jgi:hypothetical protein
VSVRAVCVGVRECVYAVWLVVVPAAWYSTPSVNRSQYYLQFGYSLLLVISAVYQKYLQLSVLPSRVHRLAACGVLASAE